MSTDEVDIALVMLCYKEGERVRQLVKRAQRCLEERNLTYQLVIVSNYWADQKGKDPTPDIVRDIASHDSRITPVTLEKNGGCGWDLKTGFKVAHAKTIAYIDGDGQNPIEDARRVYDVLMSEGADMALTYRVKRLDGLERILISRIYNFILRMLFPRVTVYDANSKPKIFTKQAFQKLTLDADNMFFDAEFVVQACYKNFRIAQVPTVFLKQSGRPSFVKVWTIIEFLRDLVMYRLRFNQRIAK